MDQYFQKEFTIYAHQGVYPCCATTLVVEIALRHIYVCALLDQHRVVPEKCYRTEHLSKSKQISNKLISHTIMCHLTGLHDIT